VFVELPGIKLGEPAGAVRAAQVREPRLGVDGVCLAAWLRIRHAGVLVGDKSV
jgi:hypothetical protein